jgi:hypothetical protein
LGDFTNLSGRTAVDEGDREYVNGGRKSESRFCFAKADFVKNILRRFRKKSKKTN